MKQRYSILLIFSLLLACCLPQDSYAIWPFKKKKKEEKKEVLTPYQKLFKGKKVQTARGLMTLHKVNDKIYVEFPTRLLGREMLLVSAIENTSDGGEGAPGQLGGKDVRFRFELIDSTIVVRMPLLSKPINSGGDARIDVGLERSHKPGIFKSFKVLACTPDSTALVVDMKSFFLEGSSFTKPFPAAAANSYYGFVSRKHSLVSEKSSILSVDATPACIGVREELAYKVDHTLMGSYSMYEDVPLTAVVSKMLYLLPGQPMAPRMADSRLGMTTILKSDFQGVDNRVREVRYAHRWRIDPADSAAHQRGESVRPVKQLVFYVDSLMPVKWFPYIKAGAESWNKAFEKIGFKDVIRVEKFPQNDTLFNANGLETMTIRYSASWMNSAQATLHADSRTGEILHASILLNANLISVQYTDRIAATAAIDPRVRTKIFPQEVQGEMIQAAVAEAMGNCLGLTVNWGAPYAYPVDSLRSASFTREHGLASSVMSGGVVINDVATADEVKQGVCLVNVNPGPYDELVIKYLYKPIYEASPEKEKGILDRWIREHSGDARYAYIRSQPSFDADPRNSREGLGDDALKSLECMLPNLRAAYANYYDWFSKDDRDLSMRRRVYSALCDRLSSRIYTVLSYVGGIYLNDVRDNDSLPAYTIVDKATQRTALQTVLQTAKNLDWLDEAARFSDFPITDKKVDALRLNLFKAILARLSYVEVGTERFQEETYTTSEYMNDIFASVWNPTLENKPLNHLERTFQTAFLESVISASSATAPLGSFGKSQKSVSVAVDNAVEARRLMEKLRGNPMANNLSGYEYQGEEVCGFKPVPAVRTDNTKISAYYFDMLMRVKDLLTAKLKGVINDADHSHYELLLYKIRKATEFE